MNITVVVKEPFKPFEIRQMEKSLDAYSDFIGNTLGVSSLSPDVQMIYNDEYLLDGSTPNLKYRDPRINHIICGNVIFMSMNDYGETVDMTQDEAEHLKRWLEILFHSYTEEEAKKVDPANYAVVEILTFE